MISSKLVFLRRIALNAIKLSYLKLRSAFQSGAFTYAKNQGIGLIRIMPDDQVKWVTHLITSQEFNRNEQHNPDEFNRALQYQQFQSSAREFYSEYDGYIFGDWQSLLRYTLEASS